MPVPTLHKARTVNSSTHRFLHPDGRWLPARPINVNTALTRFKLAWGVFIGRYDALDWEDDIG